LSGLQSVLAGTEYVFQTVNQAVLIPPNERIESLRLPGQRIVDEFIVRSFVQESAPRFHRRNTDDTVPSEST